MLSEWNLINMNGRLYDPTLGRFLSPDNYVQLPDNSQSYNRYSYCINNPLKYTDPEGEFIFSITVNAILNTFENIINHGFNVSQYRYKQTKQSWDIYRGLFKGSLLQVLSKWTWELPQTMLGYTIAQGTNMLGMVDNVTDMDGMVAIGGVGHNGAFTIGSYSFGPNNYKADWHDHLFVHEYGHYMQSQRMGPFFLKLVAIPSALSYFHVGDHDHGRRWFEVDANALAAKHFDKKYGSGAEGYVYNSKDYFDRKSFVYGGYSPYINPRKKKYNNEVHFTDNVRQSGLDYIIPIFF